MRKLIILFTVLAAVLMAVPTHAQVLKALAPAKKANPIRSCAPKQLTPRMLTAAQGEYKDEHGLIFIPADGVHKVYRRAGTCYYYDDGEMLEEEQSDAVETVECADGTVYIKDIVSCYATGVWVKGTKAGNTITVPTRQPVNYIDDLETTISVRWGRLNVDGKPIAADNIGNAFTFKIENDVITLQGTSTGPNSHFMGVFWDDDDASTGYGDAESTWSPIAVVNQVDELPYINDFETEESRYSFFFIDANFDGQTWTHIYNTDDEHYLRYKYNSVLAADDWAISPAIRLEAGKLYSVAFDTRSSGSEEKIEMKMGSAANVEAMTTPVIVPTEVSWEENRTLGNRRVSVSQTGYYYFGIHAISPEDCENLYADNFVVEVVETQAPAAITDLKAEPVGDKQEILVSFTAPGKNIGGADLTSNLTKIELMRDESIIHIYGDIAPGTALTYTDNDPELTNGNHSYQVVAYNDKGEGEGSDVVTVRLNAILEIPFVADLKQEGQFSAFTVIDANDDGSTWGWEPGYWTSYHYHAYNTGDDYLVSPRLHLMGGKNYNLVVNALTSGYTERFEVKIGKEPDPEKFNTLMEPIEVSDYSDEGTFYEQAFSVEEEGIYYIAVHAISDPDMDHLTLNSMTVEFGPEPTAPDAPAIEAIADAKGSLKAVVRATASTLAVNGTPLTANLTRIDFLRDGEVVGTVENVAPGAVAVYEDVPEMAGEHTYQAIPYNADGIGKKSEKLTVFVGVDTPARVENFTVADNATTIMFNWDKVGDEGATGRYVNPDNVEYLLYGTKWEESWLGTYLAYDDETLIATLQDADSYSLEYNTDEGEQRYDYWVIVPKSDAGEGENTVTGLIVGAPYLLPVEESFTDNSLHFFWDTDGEPMAFALGSDDDENALALITEEDGERYFGSGKFSLDGVEDPVFTFDVMGSGITAITVRGSADGKDMVVLQENIPITDAYTNVSVPLTSLMGGRYARVEIAAQFTNASVIDFFTGEITELGDVLALDNLRIGGSLSGDGISEIASDGADKDTVYTIDGRMVGAKKQPMKGQKGIYIVNGKKVVVK